KTSVKLIRARLYSSIKVLIALDEVPPSFFFETITFLISFPMKSQISFGSCLSHCSKTNFLRGVEYGNSAHVQRGFVWALRIRSAIVVLPLSRFPYKPIVMWWITSSSDSEIL